MFSRTFHCFLFGLAVILGADCAHDSQLPQAVSACGTQSEIYVTSSSDEDGREFIIERTHPAQGNCDDVLVTQLRYDDHGALTRRVDERARCGVIEESEVAVRAGQGWTVERSRDLNHDDRMDERSVAFVPAATFARSDTEATEIACAISGGDDVAR